MMLQSMTGFARSEGTTGRYRWAWEFRSVNGKGLDIRPRLPQGLEHLAFEADRIDQRQPELAQRVAASGFAASAACGRFSSASRTFMSSVMNCVPATTTRSPGLRPAET